MTSNNTTLSRRFSYSDSTREGRVQGYGKNVSTIVAQAVLATHAGSSKFLFEKQENKEWVSDVEASAAYQKKIAGQKHPSHSLAVALSTLAGLASELAKAATKDALSSAQKTELMNAFSEVVAQGGVILPELATSFSVKPSLSGDTVAPLKATVPTGSTAKH